MPYSCEELSHHPPSPGRKHERHTGRGQVLQFRRRKLVGDLKVTFFSPLGSTYPSRSHQVKMIWPAAAIS
jgi:hypothetical protein